MRLANPLFSIVALVSTLIFATTAATCEPTTQAKDPIAREYFAVGAARTRAELALRSAQHFFEESKTNVAVLGDELENARSKSASLIERALSNEQHKPEADRSDEVLEDLTRRSHAMSERWQRLLTVERPAVAARYESASSSLVTITAALTAANTLEQQWKDLELDLAPIEAAYLEIARRADRAREQGQTAVDGFKQQRDDWESIFRNTLASIGPRAGPRPTGVPSGL